MIEQFNSLVGSLSAFMQHAGKTRAVLGLSGGVDSALTAKIAVEALGAENVTAVLMPNKALTDPQNMEDAKAWAEELGIEHYMVPIAPFLANYELPWGTSELAEMNLNARVRATLIYHLANSLDAIVLGTGNKTELMLGYFTKYGDGAVDIEVLGELYKTDVWAMAEVVGLPAAIVQKTPSAELKPGHTDEEEMGVSYKDADLILQAIEKGGHPVGEAAERVKAMMKKAEHKQVMPPALKL